MDSNFNIQNSKNKTENLKIRLYVLSPMHIGCDDVYEPTSFFIDENKKKLIEFDPMDFVKSLNEKQRTEFLKVCSGDNLLAIMKFIKNNSTNIKGREVDIVAELISHYKKVLAMSTFDRRAVINQFTIQKTAYNPHNNTPYIPGSSLKGSMRTAYLSALAQLTNNQTFWRSCGLLNEQDLKNPAYTYNQIGKKHLAKKLEQKLLNGDFETDPFRMVKISDLLPVGEVKTKIVYAVNKRKKKNDLALLSERGGVYQIFETIEQGAVFEGVVNINSPEQSSGIRSSIKAENLLLSAHKFYAENLKSEIRPLNATIGIKHQAGMYANAKFKERFKQDVFLIRLGRHSGAEAVTIEGNRFIKIMQADGAPPVFTDHASTLWLASESPRPQNNAGLIPFGWAAIEVIDGF